jgi:DNA uptake protein ComE-like DNA-binding protein
MMVRKLLTYESGIAERTHLRHKIALVAVVILLTATVDLGARDGTNDWVVLENCRFVSNSGNDGDSFHVSDGTKEYIFRLYLVDAPETDAADPARLIKQAKHFGISEPQVIELGETAKSFVQKELAEPFTVYTRMAHAMGRSGIERFYAFVQTKDGDLGEQLIANGLARIHGTRAAPPGASSSAAARQKLEELEDGAKRQKLGGWAANIESSNAPTESSTTTRIPSASVPSTASSTASPPSTSKNQGVLPGKIDVNTATEKELQTIPGIGPVMARRIIDARPFRSADDLRKVNGIGEKRYQQLRPYFQ